MEWWWPCNPLVSWNVLTPWVELSSWELETKSDNFISSYSQLKAERGWKCKTETVCLFLTDPQLGHLGAVTILVLVTETERKMARNKPKLQAIAQTHFQVLRRSLKCKIIGTWNCPFNFCVHFFILSLCCYGRERKKGRADLNCGWKTGRDEEGKHSPGFFVAPLL